jgi:hypothetical protein
MDLIYLHGAPAVGKLTVAKELQQMTGATLFDNHASIDFAKMVLEFGTNKFWELVHDTRISVFAKASQTDMPLMIFTSCYSHPADLPLYDQIYNTLNDNGGRVLPVFLECETSAREERVSNSDRVARKKISSIAHLKAFDSRNQIAPVPYPNCLHLRSDIHNPVEISEKIIAHYGLQEKRPTKPSFSTPKM